MPVTWTRTRNQLAQMVLEKLRVVGPGETPAANDLTAVYASMDAVLKSLHADSILPWKISTAPAAFNTVAATQTAATGVTDMLYPLVLGVTEGTAEYPVEIITNTMWQEIQDKSTVGRPQRCYFAGATVYLWPIPDKIYPMRLTYQKVIDDTADATAPDVLASMMRSLRDIVCADSAMSFGVDLPTIGVLKEEERQARYDIRRLANNPLTAIPVKITDY